MTPLMSARPETLGSLFEWMDGLSVRPPMDALRERLNALSVDADEWERHAQFSDNRYMRNLVHEGNHYHALFLCWKSGQRSPIHDHAQSVCGLKVLTGVATETVFESSPSGLLKARGSSDHHAGAVAVSRDSDIHQISNLQAEGVDLVTLHIYSPALLSMKCYSITDRFVGEFRPFVDEFVHGGGI